MCDRRGTGGTSSGIVGTGGAFLGPGEGERKVLSVIDALLLLLCTLLLNGCLKLPAGLPTED